MLVIVFVMVGGDNKNNLLTVSFKINEDILLIKRTLLIMCLVF